MGDHLYADVHVSKNVLRWRTALITRELENELSALEAFKPKQVQLLAMMDEKIELEHRFSLARIALQRLELGYGPQVEDKPKELKQGMYNVRQQLVALDIKIGELAKEAAELGSTRWGS